MSILSRLLPRRTPTHPPREAWVVVLDADQREVTTRIPVVIEGAAVDFLIRHSLSFLVIEGSSARWLRIIDADGETTDIPILPACF